MFQHTAARRRLLFSEFHLMELYLLFQHTAARRRLLDGQIYQLIQIIVSTHSRPKAAAYKESDIVHFLIVSTHSRPKAAAHGAKFSKIRSCCFNTQPPEGGCFNPDCRRAHHMSFNTQPPEGGCTFSIFCYNWLLFVSTHSRPKAAAPYLKKQAKSAY